MSRLGRVLGLRLTSDATAARVVQVACFAAGPAVLVVALRALPRFAATPGEVFLGVLTSSAVALLLVVMGLVLPLLVGKAAAEPSHALEPAAEPVANVKYSLPAQ